MLKPKTIAQQSNLAKYSRSGEPQDLILSKPENVYQYRRLVFNVVLGILKQAYPIALKAIGHEKFSDLSNQFFKFYNCQSPQVWKLPLEFSNWFKAFSGKKDYPEYLSELLYFEWLEIQIHTQQNEDVSNFSVFNFNEQSNLKLNPYIFSILLGYPFHKTQKENWIQEKGQFPIIIYRDFNDHQVRFMAVSQFGFGIIGFIKSAEEINYKEFVEILKSQNPNIQFEILQNQVTTFLKELSQKGILFEIAN